MRKGRIEKHVTKVSIRSETMIFSILYGSLDIGVVRPSVMANERMTNFARPAVMKSSGIARSRRLVVVAVMRRARRSTGIASIHAHHGLGRREAFVPR